MGDAAPRRYDRVWVGAGWAAARGSVVAAGSREVVAAWIASGRPLVATRRASPRGDAGRGPAGDQGRKGGPAEVALGLVLPPGAADRRVALVVPAEVVVRVAPPLALRDVLPAAPRPWRAPLAALDVAARRAGLTLRVHGSLAWQHLSGVAHVTPSSDVDLVVRPRDGVALRRLLALLAAADAAAAGPRLDGEVILPGERGVAWRELASGTPRLLVRSAGGVALLPRAEALGRLGGGAP